MNHKTILSVILTLTIIIVASLGIMFFARGYQLDFGSGDLNQTGIISINSTPTGGLIYLNDVPKDVTNNSVTGLKQGSYTVKVEKAGYHTWTKNVETKLGQVTQVHALLISSFPEIKPLTITGAQKPLISPDRKKIIYSVSQNSNEQQSGIWILDLSGNPFNILSRPTLLIADTDEIKYSTGELRWSSDSQSFLVSIGENNHSLVDIQNKETAILSADQLATVTQEWAEEQLAEEKILLQSFEPQIRDILPTSETKIWSPDQTKLLFTEETEDTIRYKILDLKPVDNANVADTPEKTKTYTVFEQTKNDTNKVEWYSDSKHILLFEPSTSTDVGQISILEIEGTNKTGIFSGKVFNGNVFAHPDGSKIIILTNFSSDEQQSNLYSISLY